MSIVDIQLAEKKHEQAIFECVGMAYSMYIERMGKKPAPMLSDYSKLIEKNVVYIATNSEEFLGRGSYSTPALLLMLFCY
ncbi:hypothetical protein [Desulfosporosinus sp. OT]|uniref:hypothetical protein n=1 Tax=Desulfosporosinus sp. OT TaxID=913865 RepID=UPI000223A343|nr:hypothetical protein [Desulfosporosinus sp. OT]EGW37235.1 hypothetical protein DOT_4774 [Desulfosporosinus sp. OT]